jgi:hypothetical protein
MKATHPVRLAALLAAALLAACGERPPPSAPAPAESGPAAATAPVSPTPDTGLPEGTLGLSRDELSRLKWTGDFPGMVERRLVRILAPYSRTS